MISVASSGCLCWSGCIWWFGLVGLLVLWFGVLLCGDDLVWCCLRLVCRFVDWLVVWVCLLVGLGLFGDLIVLVLQFFAYLPDVMLNLLVWYRYSVVAYCFGLMLICCLNFVVVLVIVAIPAFGCFGLSFVISDLPIVLIWRLLGCWLVGLVGSSGFLGFTLGVGIVVGVVFDGLVF